MFKDGNVQNDNWENTKVRRARVKEWMVQYVLYPSVLVSRDTEAKVTESETIRETNVKFII